jgi:hypothetical protein
MYHPVRGCIRAEDTAEADESLEIVRSTETAPPSVAKCHIYADIHIYF